MPDAPTAATIPIRHVVDEQELRAFWTLGLHVFGKFQVPWRVLRSLWRAYPEGVLLSTHGGSMLAAFAMWPMKRRAFEELVSGSLREATITGATLYASTRPFSCATWYISDVYVRPDLRKTSFVPLFVSAALGTFHASGRLAQDISISALTSSTGGEALFRRLGFALARSAEEMPDHMPLYVASFPSDTGLRSIQERLFVEARTRPSPDWRSIGCCDAQGAGDGRSDSGARGRRIGAADGA